MSFEIMNKQPTSEAVTMIQQQGAVTTSFKEIKGKFGEEKDIRGKTAVDDPVTFILESNNVGEAGLDILRNMAVKLANTGIVLQAGRTNLKNNPFEKEEADNKTKGKDEIGNDKATINFSSGSTLLSRAVKNINLKLDLNFGGRSMDQETEQVAQQYASVFYEYLTDDKTKPKEQLKKLENILKSKGLSEENIFSIQKQVRASIRADISLKIKDSLLFKELAGSKIEEEFYKQSIFDLLDGATEAGLIPDSGKDKEKNEEAQKIVDSAAKEAWKELGEMSLEDLESRLIRKMVSNKGTDEEMSKLLENVKKSGKDLVPWLAEWAKKKENLGFNLIDVPASAIGAAVDTNTDSDGKGSRDREEYRPISEVDILASRLKVQYMARLLTGGIGNYITTSFKIRKIKGGLMALGVYTKELDKKVKDEAETEAREKTSDMLKEALLEKASLFTLKGSSFKLVDMKIRSLVGNAKRLGIEINDAELENMQYNANNRMRDIIRRQIEMIEPVARRSSNLKIQKSYKNLKKLYNRLGEEMNKGTKVLKPEPEMKSVNL